MAGQKFGGETGTFMAYLDGKELIGTCEVKLPEIKFKTTTVDGAGLLGEVELRNPYAIESMEAEIKFNTIADNGFSLMNLNGKLLELKAAIIEADGSTHAIGASGLRVVMRGEAKSVDLGTIKTSELLNTSFKHEITFIEVFKDGKSLYKVDKFNKIITALGITLVKKLTDLF